MEGNHTSWHAPLAPHQDRGQLAALARAFRVALAAPDVREATRMVAEAAEQGTPAARLYVDVVRPALADLQGMGAVVRARVAAGIGESILAGLVSGLPTADRRGAGRAAVLSCRSLGIEAVDGNVAMDFLESDGWSVDLRAHSTDAPVAHFPHAGGIELAVAVTAGPEDALRLAPMCTELRRLADPPVIVLCDFSGRSDHAAAAISLGADAVAHDPAELVQFAAHSSAAPGRRRWGVRLSRSGRSLQLAPTGRLDATSVGRLADVASTRVGTFDRLVLDLSDLAEIEPAGLAALADWRRLSPTPEVKLELLPGHAVRAGLELSGVVSVWQIAEPVL
ncbi:MAG: STAS domain-containing protein [Solirubrobacteraceae bacterium]